MFNQIKNVLLFVTNLDKSIDFYQNSLGLKIKTKEVGYIEFDLEGTILSIVSKEEASKMIHKESVEVTPKSGQNFAIAVHVDDVDKVCKNLKAKGVSFIKEPFTQPWGQKTAYFEDPDKHLWEIHS